MVRIVAVVVLTLTGTCVAGVSVGQAAVPSCPALADFNPASFSRPTAISNSFLPLAPGTQLTFDGTIKQGGKTVPHRVVFTVTDMTKVVDGVRTVVVWDVDQGGDQVLEAELAFFAQDDAGNVWNVGEYPEEFEKGTFIGAPSTWLAGLNGAQPGIHMAASPQVSTKFYLQGFAPDIEFLDCARVTKTAQRACVPAGCFDNVLVTQEKDAFDPASGLQLKYHAPGVGIVQIGAIGDPQAETLALVSAVRLGEEAMEGARGAVVALDQRGYQSSAIYAQTGPAERPPAAAPPEPPPSAEPTPPPAPRPVVVAGVRRQSLSARNARAAVRRVLRARLRGWRITGVSCRLRSGRASCTFTATRRGHRARGSGTVSRSGSVLRARLTAKITTNGCHPASSRRCTRSTRWS